MPIAATPDDPGRPFQGPRVGMTPAKGQTAVHGPPQVSPARGSPTRGISRFCAAKLLAIPSVERGTRALASHRPRTQGERVGAAADARPTVRKTTKVERRETQSLVAMAAGEEGAQAPEGDPPLRGDSGRVASRDGYSRHSRQLITLGCRFGWCLQPMGAKSPPPNTSNTS
jgi:hypothetical protein